MSSAEHARRAAASPEARSIPCAVLTVSDTRSSRDDQSGDLIVELLTAAGHRCVARVLVRDEASEVEATLRTWIASPECRVVLITGGTGFARRDVTVEAVRGFFTADIEGFGELFRSISHGEIGSAAMLSRAVAGLVARPENEGGDTFIFAMPGSPAAVRTAMTQLILPELAHLFLLRRAP